LKNDASKNTSIAQCQNTSKPLHISPHSAQQRIKLNAEAVLISFEVEAVTEAAQLIDSEGCNVRGAFGSEGSLRGFA
jgi:trimethylamine:corrinoid methyltransferase-like protein